MKRSLPAWPVLVIALPAAVAVWSGWVGLGELCGFGEVHPLPGINDRLVINSAITLPIGAEAYAAYALRVWLAKAGSKRAQGFAKWSAIASLILAACGQIAYHLMKADEMVKAPWQVTALVSVLPVAVLGMAATLAHLVSDEEGVELTKGKHVHTRKPKVPESPADTPTPVVEEPKVSAKVKTSAPIDVDLEAAALAVKDRVEARGDKLTRKILIDELHADEIPIGTNRATELLHVVRGEVAA